MIKPRLIGASYTHPGNVRTVNEDSVMVYVNPDTNQGYLGFMIVADGIGGHKAGDIASKITVDTVYNSLSWFLEGNINEETQPSPSIAQDFKPENQLERRLRRAIEVANRKILNYAQNNPEKAGNLGSTVTCALVQNNLMTVAHVGDSRAYILRNGSLTQITEDHSFVGQLVREGQLTEDAFYIHPRRNIITRALGQNPTIQIDMHTWELIPEDKLLFCTDGLWEMVRDNELKTIMEGQQPPEILVNLLIEAANKNGGIDNIGAVLGYIES